MNTISEIIENYNGCKCNGGGGGSSTPLICHYADGHLDTTIGEIRDAIVSGRTIVYIYNNDTTMEFLKSITTAGQDDGGVITYYSYLYFGDSYMTTDPYDTFDEALAAYPFYSD